MPNASRVPWQISAGVRERLEMRGPRPLGLARRMEGIADAEEPGDLPVCRQQVVGDEAGDPPAHRLAADDHRRT